MASFNTQSSENNTRKAGDNDYAIIHSTTSNRTIKTTNKTAINEILSGPKDRFAGYADIRAKNTNDGTSIEIDEIVYGGPKIECGGKICDTMFSFTQFSSKDREQNDISKSQKNYLLHMLSKGFYTIGYEEAEYGVFTIHYSSKKNNESTWFPKNNMVPGCCTYEPIDLNEGDCIGDITTI